MQKGKQTVNKKESNCDGTFPLESEMGDITTAYIKSMEEISARYLGLIKRQALQNLVSPYPESLPAINYHSGIGSAENRNELFAAIKSFLDERLKSLDFTIFLIDSSGEYHTPYIFKIDRRIDMPDQIKAFQSAYSNIDDGVFGKVLHSRIPVFFDMGDLVREHRALPYIDGWNSKGFGKVVGIPLTLENKNLGCLFVFFEKDMLYPDGNDHLVGLSQQISKALFRITALEDSAIIENRRASILLLANEMALVRNTEELTRGIGSKLKRFFSISAYRIFNINHENLIWQPLEGGQGKLGLNNSRRTFWTGNEAINADLFNAVMNSDRQYVYDSDLDASLDTFAQDVSYWKSFDIDKVIGFPLRVRGVNMGVIFMVCEPTVSTRSIDFRLLKDAISHISSAVGNIVEHAALRRQEEEKSKLLDFCEGIATARDKVGLSLLVKPYLNTIFGIGEFIITLKNSDRITYSYFLHGLQSEEPVDLGPNFRSYSEVPEKGSLIEQVMLSEEPVVFELSQLIRSGALWEYVGAKNAMGARLRVGNRDVGILWTQPGQISNFLLKGICSHLAIAVSNVMANEDIIQKEKERDALLSLNAALATVRNGNDLQRIINIRLKLFLNCSHALIGKISEDKLHARAYLTDPESKSKDNPSYLQVLKIQHEINDGLMNRAAISSSPVAFNLDEVLRSSDAPMYVQMNHQMGLKGLVITRLFSGNELFGFWMIFFHEETIGRDKLELIESLANQISIAIGHITINERIQEGEREKTSLLEFSTAIASVRGRGMLADIVRVQLKKLFEIEDYIIYALSENKQGYTPLLFQADHIYATNPEFIKQMTNPEDINDGVFNITLASNDPVIHNIDEIIDNGNAPSYIMVAQNYELKEIVGVSLKIGHENIAVMNFKFDERNKVHIYSHMFKSICALLAIAVENIIANEKVLKQFLEIDDYKQQLEEEQVYLKEELQTNQNYGEIIGESKEMKETFRLISQVASSESTVLILGETGTGKELVARAIHNNSPRKNKLMVKVNCAALPANLVESELFGHERGSFTGATDRRIGKFELANNGTLFLDEIGEMPLELQVKLLRAIQEKEIERIGGKGIIKVNVRIIAATNRNLEKEMEEGRFRNDLYYRLNIFPINLCALRERRDDIPLLAKHFINRYAKKTGRKISVLSSKVLQELSKYSWPGNVRELEHLLERSVLLAQGETLKQVYLPREKVNEAGQAVSGELVLKTIDENEREHIILMLKYCDGRIAGPTGAASLLGVPPSTLNSKIKKLGIRREYLP